MVNNLGNNGKEKIGITTTLQKAALGEVVSKGLNLCASAEIC